MIMKYVRPLNTIFVFLIIVIEWPVYETEGGQKSSGNINILQLTSDVTTYTVILELYNFAANEQHLKSIGSKLKAIFSLNVACFTGCRQQGDYTRLRRQYPLFDLPKEAYKKMDDVGVMAVHRGVTSYGKDKTKLDVLCKGQGYYLRKPRNVRVGTCFASKGGSLSQEAQKYCHLDVEAPLILHDIYSKLPDLTSRLTRKKIALNSRVDIMPKGGSVMTPIAQGIVKQVEGWWIPGNNYKLRAGNVVIEVDKVFNPKGIIHYPLQTCSCKRNTHGNISEDCDVYLYNQLGPPPFKVVELNSRLRSYNDEFRYPACVVYENYDGPRNLNNSMKTSANRIGIATEKQMIDGEGSNSDEENDDDISENDNDADASSSIPEIRLSSEEEDALASEIMDMLRTGYADEDGTDSADDDTPTASQAEMVTNEEMNEQIRKLIEDADKLSIDENECINNDSFEFDEFTEDDDVSIGNLPHIILQKCVLGDIFHFMDRAKLPMHHQYKALFFRALRGAMFIMHKGDVDKVKAVLHGKAGLTWEKKLAFDFKYITQRVRRRVPPQLLYIADYVQYLICSRIKLIQKRVFIYFTQRTKRNLKEF